MHSSSIATKTSNFQHKMKIILKTLSFVFLSAVIGSISASPALTKEDASNALAKRDLNEDCFKEDRTHPCV